MVSFSRLGAMLLCLLMLAGCGGYSWNQKMTVEVDTPSGVVSGSSVAFVRMQKDFNMTNAFFRDTGSAEATVVELPDGRYLFALLKPPSELAYHAFRANFPQGIGPGTNADNARHWLRVISNGGLSAELPRKAYPLLATFTDVGNPMTIRKVDPDNLAATFGPGVSLRRITLETTNEAITEGGVKKVLNWLGELDPEQYRDPNNRFKSRLPSEIGLLKREAPPSF